MRFAKRLRAMAAVEICALCAYIGLGALAFVLGDVSPNQASVMTLVLLLWLDVLAWRRFDQGRHPCFLFLAVLTLLQGGRFIAYCAGVGDFPLRIAGVAPHPFDISRQESGIVLLCLALSSVCIYIPCRWNYRRIRPPSDLQVRQYLPYLYLVFYATLPIQLYKSYAYYNFIQEHGGYLHFWLNHADVAGSVPFIVRAIVVINFPAFLAIFVFECKRRWLCLATMLYFTTAIFILLIGLRSGVFALVLVLWYVAGIKSSQKGRTVAIAVIALFLVILGDVVQTLREDTDATLADYTFAPMEFIRLQGGSLDVTAAAVKYQKLLAPHALSYLWNELQDAFMPRDIGDYEPGKRLSYDITVLLNRVAFSVGEGTAGSYVGELYLLGGVLGVVVFSLTIGGGLHLMYLQSRNAFSLFVVASILPVTILMPRGQLLDWASDLMKTAISVAILATGWVLYCTLLWLRHTPRREPSFGKEVLSD